MKLLELWRSFFPDRGDSRRIVKDRLRMILAQDRSFIPPEVLSAMRVEMLEVVSRYFEIEPGSTEINLETDEKATILTANLPIVALKNVKPRAETTISFVLDLN